MGDEKREQREGCQGGGSGAGGYSIFLEEQEMAAFMEAGDFSSALNLHHFEKIEAEIEKRLKGKRGFSLLALSLNGKRLSRDFSVLQVAHLLAKHGKRVLIVDCDFLNTGLSGLVEKVEDHGFLDLLLYGSSLKSVLRPTGIDGVSVTGPGSFPVSKTVPFAKKEFITVNDFLSQKCDIVIYCSTCYTDEKVINPLTRLVDGLLLCCRLDLMEEGQLQKIIDDLGKEVPPLNIVCICSKKEEIEIPVGERIKPPLVEPEAPVPETMREEKEEEEKIESVNIEKTEEIIETAERGKSRKGVNIPRLITIIIASMVIIFSVWWFGNYRTFQKESESNDMANVIKEQQEAERKNAQLKEVSPVTEDEAEEEGVPEQKVPAAEEGTSVKEETSAGETAEKPVQAQEGSGEESREDSGREVSPSGEERPAEPEATTVTPAPEGKHYSVHVASFREISRAGQESDYLEGKGFVPAVMEVDIRGEKWFRIMVGEYATREEALQTKMKLMTLKRIGYARIVLVDDK
ncbi:MAG: SPOR domain-containing protein [Candidatus Krumholzibacteriota bacterium]|nr:SPOR domain-containing protein [Candidatus Krumholzibacteriota bacterium]